MTGRRHTSSDYRFAPIPEALLYDTAISPNAVRIYGALMRHGTDPDSCFPSYERLGNLVGLAPRSVPRLISDLEAAGWVSVDRSGGVSNHYQVHIEARICARPEDGTPRDSARGPRASQRDDPARPRAPKESNERKPTNEGSESLFDPDQARAALIAETFVELWKAWPPTKRYDREKCLTKFTAAMKNADATLALAKARAMIAARQADGSMRFIPDLSTWINQKRWEADVEAPPTPPSEFI